MHRNIEEVVDHVVEAFCDLTYVQHAPVAIYHHFIDYIHLLCFAPVNVVLRSGGMRMFSVPQFAAVAPTRDTGEADESHLLDRYEDADCGVTIDVYGLHESAQLPVGTLKLLVEGIRLRSPAAGAYLAVALTDGIFDHRRLPAVPKSRPGERVLDPEVLLEAAGRLRDRLAPTWKQFLSHEDLRNQLCEDPRKHPLVHQTVRAGAAIRYVPVSHYTRNVQVGRGLHPLPYEICRLGSSQVVIPETGMPPRQPEFEDLSLYGGHLQVGFEDGEYAVAIPIHVGGTAWLVVTLFPAAGFSGWRQVLRFYSLALPRLAEDVRTIAQDAFLDAIRLVLRIHAPWTTGRAWSLEQLNDRLFQLSMVFPYPVVCINDVPFGQADVSPDGHPIRVDIQEEARPLPAELEYRPLTARTVRDECMDELRAYEQQWVKQTDALVAGVYKIGHQLGHTVAPLKVMLKEVQRLLLEYRETGEESLLNDLGQSVGHAVLIGEKADRKSLILDVIATATLENTAQKTFLKATKPDWRNDEPFVLDLEGLERLSGEQWTFVGASPVDLRCRGALSITIGPWLQDQLHRWWRPTDRAYMEILHEIIFNAGRYGKVAPQTRKVWVDVYLDEVVEGDQTRTVLVFENDRRHPNVDLTIPYDGVWYEWPTGKGAPSGGLYFLTMFTERTDIGRIYTRLSRNASQELFAIALWFRGMTVTTTTS